MTSSKRMKYTDEQKEFIRSHPDMPRKDLHELFMQTFGVVTEYKTFKRNCTRFGAYTGRTGRYGDDRPRERMPIGTEIRHPDRIVVKIGQPSIWTTKQRKVWEDYNGPIPEGYVIAFKDGDSLNCDIDNLELITKQELAVIAAMGLHVAPVEMRETIRLLARVSIKEKEATKNARKRG